MNTLNYSIRYLLKNRANSATRIISLSLGLIVALVIISFVGLKLSYNSFFPDKERIYQVWNISPQFGLNGVNNYMVLPLAPNMANDIPQIEAATHYLDNLLQINHNGNNIDVDTKLNNSMLVSCRTMCETSLCCLLRSLTQGSG